MLIRDTVCDVLIVGGGTAGAIAAIQAARAGARTAVLERCGILGGAVTIGGVPYPAHFFSRERQIIAGIGWEIVQKSLALGPFPMPDYSESASRAWHPHIHIEPNVFACLLEEACLDAGVDLTYYSMPMSIAQEKEGWVVEVMEKGPCRHTIHCREVVDCTGDADVVGMLGLPRDREDEVQPGTLIYVLQGYDAADLDPELVESKYQQAMATGELQTGDIAYADGGMMTLLRGHGMNHQHIRNADATTAQRWTDANILGRQSVLRVLRFLRGIPGGENAYIENMQPETAMREGYRIVGESTITGDDYQSGRHFPDAIAYAYYGVDIHHMGGVAWTELAPGVQPTIPFSALLPRGSKRLLVAGRCLSCDHIALAGLRVQAPCMAMGQAAGAAAALAVKLGVPSCDVPYDQLCALLTEHGALVPQVAPCQ